MRSRMSVLTVALALVSCLIGDRLHLALEHHHWCPVTGEPVHHEDPGAPCGSEEPSPHAPHPASGHLHGEDSLGVVKQVQIDAVLPSSSYALPDRASVSTPVAFLCDRPRDPPRARFRPSRAPPSV